MDKRTNPLNWPAWAWRCLIALALMMAAFSIAASLSNVARSAGLLRDLGNHGMTLRQPAGTPLGWSEVVAVVPGGAAEKAGLAPGDRVRFDGLFGYSIGYGAAAPTKPAEPAAITIEHDGIRFHRAIAYPEGSPFPGTEPLVALAALTLLVTTAFGAILLIRGRRNHSAIMLGVIMLYIALASGRLPAWSPIMEVAQARVLTTILSIAAMGWFWPLFSLEISGGAATRRQVRLVHGGALVLVALGVAAAIVTRLPVAPPIAAAAWASWLAFLIGGQLFGYAIIAGNYRRNDPPARNRIKIVVFAFVCYLLSQALNQSISFLLDAGYTPVQMFWLAIGAASLSYTGLGMLVYAVLGHRLFDIGFALNRTLVYGAVSFILLAGFGLAEWSVEHLVPEAWREGGPFFTAGIALALFLSFHRLRNWVERHLERLLFRDWHLNEAALKRFVASAGHFDRAPALCDAFVGELARFAKGAGAAILLRQPDGGYALRCGTLADAQANYNGDDPLFALLRAERRPAVPAQAQTALPGTLALPMLDQDKLAGLVLLGGKPDGTDYRPDEVEVLGWAAHEVGLVLQAMHGRELEARIAGLDATVASLSEDRDRLGAMLAGSAGRRAKTRSA